MKSFHCKRSYNKQDDNASSRKYNNEVSALSSVKRLSDKNFKESEKQSEPNQNLKKFKEIHNRWTPNLSLTDIGKNAVIGNKISVPISLYNIQQFLLYSTFGKYSQCLPNWCNLIQSRKLSQKVIFVVEGLSCQHFIANKSIFSHVTNNFKYHLEVAMPMHEKSIMEKLAIIPLLKLHKSKHKHHHSLDTTLEMDKDKIKLLRTTFSASVIDNAKHLENNENKENNSEKNLTSTDKFNRVKLLLSFEEMIDEGYPVPLKETLSESSYVLTKDSYKEITATSPMFALDCEMCRTTNSTLELTRISIVDENLKVIYSSLVKPKNKIVDYLTQYSGVTREMLKNVRVTLHNVQQTLRKLLPADAILVGHDMKHDLHSLKMLHPYNIDTSIIYGNRLRKMKLQTLAREYLGEEIQNSEAGHCSVEDSRITMKLVKLKLANSLNDNNATLLDHHKVQSLETDKEVKSKQCVTSELDATNKEDTIVIVGKEEIISDYATYLSNSSLNINFIQNNQIRFVKANNNKHAISRMTEITMEHNFLLCHIKIRDEQLQTETIIKTLRNVNKRVGKLWQHNALHSLFCVIFGGQVNAANGACFLSIKTKIS